ncbi:hypothetical protein MPTK2_3g17060 [Marchantia polymorpha subsp. ruderalis]
MGEYAERPLGSHNAVFDVVEDLSVARDIARRFEQLESQWLHFQKTSAKWEIQDSSRPMGGGVLNSQLQDHIVPSTAFSYSNPLFTTHKPLKKSAASSPRAPLVPARDSLSLVSTLSPEKLPSPRIKQPMLSSSENHWSFKKEKKLEQAAPGAGQTTSSSSPSSSLSSKHTAFSPKKVLGSTEVSYYQGIHTSVPSSSSPDKTSSYSSSLNCDSLSKPSSSSSPGSATNSDRHNIHSPSIRSHQRSLDYTCHSKLPIGEYTGKLWSSPLRSPGIYKDTKQAAPDPASYSSGKGPPSLHMSRMTEEIRSTEVAQSSRSPPPVTPSASSARETDLQSDSSTMEHRFDFRGKQARHQPWHAPGEFRLLPSEGADNTTRIASQTIPEEKRSIPNLKVPDAMSFVKTSRPDTQVDWKDRTEICALMQKKLDHTVNKVEWELKLSKRESKLRSAEETLLEEQQKLAEARLALSKCEAVLSQREEAVQQLEQIRDLESARESVETGSLVIEKLVTALKDVLVEMEQKDKGLRDLWNEFKQSSSSRPELDVGNHQFGFEPDQSRPLLHANGLEGMNFLAAENDCKDWCRIVVSVCERLLSFLSHETHLQKWALILEKESARLKTLEEEILNTKDATAEHFERAAEMMRCAEEQSRVAEEERTTLNKERDSLVQWVTHLQERRKAVTACEREAASSLAEVQKKAADLFVHESSIDGKALEISALQEEIWATSQRLHEDQELVNKERMKVQDRLRQVASRERDVDSQLQFVNKLKEEFEEQKEMFERERVVEEKKRESTQAAQRELEEQLNMREMTLRDIEKELAEKAAAAESLSNQLHEREKILKSMHDQCEHERSKAKELIADLEKEKKRVKEAEDAIEEAQASKKNADEAWARVAKERREADDYLKSVEERIKAWEDRLRVKEKELQQQQLSLRDIESRIQEEQDRSRAMHAKITNEQENWNEDLKAKQDSLAKRTKILENKEAEIKSDLDKLTEERRLAIDEIKRFAEIEARVWSAERELQAKHDEHLQMVRKHGKEHRAQLEELEVARREVEREFEEVHIKRDELHIWQREAEETLQNKIDGFVKGKEELQLQIKELKKLQLDIEQAGAQIIDRVAELDQASSKLEVQRSRVESSKTKLEALAKTLSKEQEAVRERASALSIQEEKVTSALADIRKLNADTSAKERNLRYREQAVIDSEHDLKELEARLANERKDLEKMIAEVEQHAATLKDETAAAEESSRNRSREELLVEEKKEYIFAREKELAAYEAELKNKALSLEEHSQAITKLEQQVQERLQKAQDVDQGWEKLREEKAAFESERQSVAVQKEESQNWKAEQDRQARKDSQRKARLREELDRQKTEMLSKLRDREAALQIREARVAEKEESVKHLEREGKNQVLRDAQELRQQLTGARAELDSERQYVEDKRRIAEAIAATIEEREAKLRVREEEVEKMELSLQERERKLNSYASEQRDILKCYPLDSQARTIDFLKMHEEQERRDIRTNGKHENTQFQDSLFRLAGFEMSNSTQNSNSKQAATLEQERNHAAKKQEEELTIQRLKQMEETLQKEASKIIQERLCLKSQQKELEETRKAVQDVKVTLTAQLKATKQMVADASLTAQNASREREALEEERRRLEKAQKEAKASMATKESKLLQETKRLENMRNALLQEKSQAMDVLQKAARIENERLKAVETNFMQSEKQAEADFCQREKEFRKTTEALHREKQSLNEEKARMKLLHDVLERGKHEQSQTAFQQAVTAEVQRKGESAMWSGINKWKEQNNMTDSHGYTQHRDEQNGDGRPEISQDLSIPSYRETVESQTLGTNSETSSRVVFTPSPPERMDQHCTNVTSSSWDEAFRGSMLLSSPGSSPGVNVHQTATGNSAVSGVVHMHEENAPSKNRLENVMTSLINARQASRSRLQRTENALLGFPPSSPFTSQVQQALNALSSRLSLMEQIEDGLASHLRKAYELEYPETEGVIVDKVQLLCRMEEQQSLRAEWEEDMQQQLETISMLQAASRNGSSFNTPIKGTNLQDKFQSSPPQNDWPGVDAQRGNTHTPLDGGTPGLSRRTSGSSGPNPSQQYASPEWKMTFEPLLGVDSKGLSLSPLVDYNYNPNSVQKLQSEYASRGYDNTDNFVRRKLYLSPSTKSHNATH